MISKQGSSGFAISSRYSNKLGFGKTVSKLQLSDYRHMKYFQLLNNRGCRWNSRTFYYFIGIENQCFGMLTLLIWNAIFFQLLFKLAFYRRCLRNKHIIPFGLSKQGCPYSTFSSSKYDNSLLHYSCFYFISVSMLPT